MCNILELLDQNPWRNNLSKLGTFDFILQRPHSALSGNIIICNLRICENVLQTGNGTHCEKEEQIGCNVLNNCHRSATDTRLCNDAQKFTILLIADFFILFHICEQKNSNHPFYHQVCRLLLQSCRRRFCLCVRLHQVKSYIYLYSGDIWYLSTVLSSLGWKSEIWWIYFLCKTWN